MYQGQNQDQHQSSFHSRVLQSWTLLPLGSSSRTNGKGVLFLPCRSSSRSPTKALVRAMKSLVLPQLSGALSDLSSAFDPEWNTNGFQEKVVDLFVTWVKLQNIAGLQIEVRVSVCFFFSSSCWPPLRTNPLLFLRNTAGLEGA